MKGLIGKVCVFVTGLTVFMGTLPANVFYADAAEASELSISQNGIDFICEREGFSSTCYYDGSQSSIGYGTRCGDKAHSSGLHTITEEQASAEMENVINSVFIPKVRKQTEGIQMNQNQFDALVSFAYNTGGGTSMIKNSPLVKYLQGSLSEEEARSAYSSYIVTGAASGGKVLQGLVNRRNCEADLFFSGDDCSSSGNITENTGTSYIIKTQVDPLNMRKSPDNSSDIITRIPKGTKVNVSEISNGWAYVIWNGYEGYCSMTYLEPENTSDNNSSETNTAVSSEYVVNTQIDPLNMRKESDDSSDIITRIPKGTKVEVKEIKDNWAYVSWNGYEGYCSMTYLKSVDTDTSSEEYVVNTQIDPLNMRKEPDSSAGIITRIPKGTKVEVKEIKDNWAYVIWNGFEGYCSMTYLSKN